MCYAKDCFFFEFVQDMNANIPSCNFHGIILDRHDGCSPDCPYYIDKQFAIGIIKDYIKRTLNYYDNLMEGK